MTRTIVNYEITAKLYESACTLVWRGRRIADGEPVVLKILKPEAATEEALASFRREFGIVSKVALPGVVRAYGLEEYRGSPMMVLEDMGGESLDRLLGREPLPLMRFLELAIGIADTLAGIHDLRIIHKDLNPANIVYNPDTGQFRLIDFGIADELPRHTVAMQPPAALEGTL
ncbi:MAG TPA: protein kinase, partial [Bacteroidota bacterium]